MLAVPVRAAAHAGRLAAVESHLRRQPQLQHGAAPRRHDAHRRRPSAARDGRRDRAQPHRSLAHGLFQRAGRLRGAAAASRTRREARALVLQEPSAHLLRRRGAAAGPVGAARSRGRACDRPSRADVVLVGHDRDRAARHRRALPARARRQCRRAGARRRPEARPERRQARSPRARPDRHARLLEATRSHRRARSTRKASTCRATRCASPTRTMRRAA